MEDSGKQERTRNAGTLGFDDEGNTVEIARPITSLLLLHFDYRMENYYKKQF